MKKARTYRKLARSLQFGVVHGGWVSLHLAADHLLLRSSNLFSESYRRFYFADIEAITVGETKRRDIWTGIFAIGLFLSALPMLLSGGVGRTSAIFAGIFVLLLAVNLLRGPTCWTRLQTRVQTRALPLRRVRKALRVIDQLSGPIAAAQANIASAEISGAAQPASTGAAPPATAGVPPPLPGESPAVAGALHLAMIAALIVSGVIALTSALQPQWAPAAYLTYFMSVANLGLAIAALVRQARRPVPPRLVPFAWSSTIAHGLLLPVVYMVYSFVYSFQKVKAGATSPEMQFPLSALRDLPGFSALLFAYAALALLLGGLGCVLFLAALRRSRESR